MRFIKFPLFKNQKVEIEKNELTISEQNKVEKIKIDDINSITIQANYWAPFFYREDIIVSKTDGTEIILNNLTMKESKNLEKKLKDSNANLIIKKMPIQLRATINGIIPLPDVSISRWISFIIIGLAIIFLLYIILKFTAL